MRPTINENRVKSRVAGRKQAELILPLIEKSQSALDADGREVFVETIANALAVPPNAAADRRQRAGPPITPTRTTDAVEDADATVATILDLVEDLPEAGEAFGESVAEKARAILRTIQRTGRVTDAQQMAMENMKDGLKAWLER